MPIPTKTVPQISFTYPNSVVTGDVNRDRNLDLVYCGATAVQLAPGNGLGDFGTITNVVAGVTTSIAMADLNKDGNPDLILGTASVNVRVALGNGNGTFQTAVSYAAHPSGTGQAQIVAVADVDSDGSLDITAALQGGSAIGILTGRGDGTFNAARTTAVTAPAGGLVAADFNGDGFVDLATLSSGTQFAVVMNRGNGTFASQTNSATGLTGVNLTSLRSVDFDGDGILDLTALSVGATKRFIAMKGQGNGTFALSDHKTLTATTVYNTALSDVTGDGRPDAVVASYTTMSLLENLGGGLFAEALVFPATSVGSVAVGLFDADNRPDVMLFSGDARLRTFLNETEFLPAIPVVSWIQGAGFTRLKWYSSYAGYSLQYSSKLGSGEDWQAAPGQPTAIDCEYFYQIGPTNPGFYRLVKQP